LEALLQRIDDVPGGTVASVNHQFQRLECGGVEAAEQVVAVGTLTGLLDQRAARFDSGESVVFGQALDVLETGVAADRLSTATYQFHAVEVDVVVAGGHFDAAVDIQVKGGEVDFFGAGQAQVDDVAAGIQQAIG